MVAPKPFQYKSFTSCPFFPSTVRVACLSPRDVSFWRRAEPPSCCKHWSLCWNWPGSTAALMPSRLDPDHYLHICYSNTCMWPLKFKLTWFLPLLYDGSSNYGTDQTLFFSEFLLLPQKLYEANSSRVPSSKLPGRGGLSQPDFPKYVSHPLCRSSFPSFYLQV